ncbi:hypothetical protein M427DRAFT_207042 [Gonapodya prolifera JEL478]|uniref:MYND-type domain-containing protein n=1 Tax=Gonapodya prolifera (strain JEL478) TaxID=1344416 RepID=A0A138ZZ70_GONPJ|nr:hypothetical protein M427DRAFT_207042 [Gonapodya prolifera JEL478]|eukprot:KXS09807.1 hypothetical protein M427DRAFT_207042 [Gonapodya prolifera JEL478]
MLLTEIFLPKITIRRLYQEICGNFTCTEGSVKTSGVFDPSSIVCLRSCATCKRIKYCSKECQKADWKAHKLFCGTSIMSQPEEGGLGASRSSQICQWLGSSEDQARGVKIEGLEQRMKRFLDSVEQK